MAAPYTVTRSTTIAAPPQRVYDLVASFPEWQQWSPWEGLDPELKRTYGGAESGQGATYAWSGNRKAGEGRMEIIEATAPAKIVIALEFRRPFKASNVTTFTFIPQGAGTEVGWTMEGPRPLVMRLLSPIFNMEKLVGGDFEKGLAKLKSTVEG